MFRCRSNKNSNYFILGGQFYNSKEYSAKNEGKCKFKKEIFGK